MEHVSRENRESTEPPSPAPSTIPSTERSPGDAPSASFGPPTPLDALLAARAAYATLEAGVRAPRPVDIREIFSRGGERAPWSRAA